MEKFLIKLWGRTANARIIVEIFQLLGSRYQLKKQIEGICQVWCGNSEVSQCHRPWGDDAKKRRCTVKGITGNGFHILLF